MGFDSEHIAFTSRMILKRGEGTVLVHRLDLKLKSGEKKSHTRAGRDEATLVFSAKYACAVCGLSFEELEPRMFSFNSPFGACPRCNGLATLQEVDPARIAFYGLSYGGESAVRIPTVLEDYCLSICSASASSSLRR